MDKALSQLRGLEGLQGGPRPILRPDFIGIESQTGPRPPLILDAIVNSV